MDWPAPFAENRGMRLYNSADGWWIERAGKLAHLPGFTLDAWLACSDPLADLRQRAQNARSWIAQTPPPRLPLGGQEVWAAGVTYLRSKTARMEESSFSATAYDRVYDAPRPEIFFKANPRHCAGPGQALHLRDDSIWMVPEPELALVLSAAGQIVGFTIGNDLSCRDIEGENLLYLPQAKIWDKCCALGPAILINDGALDIRQSSIRLDILRAGQSVFSGQTSISRIKRSFEELVRYLFRNQSFPVGAVLLTGTGIVPPDGFTLQNGDEVRMEVPEIGPLTNPMTLP